MMVPVEWTSVLDSPLFSKQAKLDYQREPERAEQLKATALDASSSRHDESVKNFVVRHFGVEVANTVAAPLLAGVLGGDIATLSARAVLPVFVALERKYGSLILGLQQCKRQGAAEIPVFTTLRNGLSGLIEGMESHIPAGNIRRGFSVKAIERIDGWRVHRSNKNSPEEEAPEQFDALLFATPAKTTARLLAPLDDHAAELLPPHSSSAIVVALAFSAEQAQSLRTPPGFGFLVPQRGNGLSHDTPETLAGQALLACTFVDQKFPHRVPAGAVLLRAFFGGSAAPALLPEDDSTLRKLALGGLQNVLGKLPEPILAPVRRWPDSLPLYAVGHLDRISELESRVAQLPNVRLVGNAYRGVGLPDLIRDGRNAAREIAAALTNAETA
jgi:oxygen-dependent protoporphyrinogen oxidase